MGPLGCCKGTLADFSQRQSAISLQRGFTISVSLGSFVHRRWTQLFLALGPRSYFFSKPSPDLKKVEFSYLGV